MRRYRLEIMVSLVLTLVSLGVYARATTWGFVNFDDDDYVVLNPHLQAGLGGEGLWWALTTTRASNWHPITWISLLLDYRLHGLHPWGYHRTNVLLHAANGVLLFLAFRLMTGAVWRSALVAALFAWHPLHVESVAWVAERKDVLSTFFGLLTLLAYVRYAGRPGWRRYVPVMVCFALGLMAKPMLVTLPCVLLLLDWWPLGRIRDAWPVPRPVLLDKVPLLILAVVSCGVTVFAQHQGGAISSLEQLPFSWRLGNAVVAYIHYLELTFWPQGLAVFYPHPRDTLPLWHVAVAAAGLIGITWLVLRLGRTARYLPVGWFWFLGTLVPVIGLVQVGGQALADRYTYVPLIGIFLLLAWGLPDFLARVRIRESLLAPAAVAALAACLVLTWRQVLTWHDGGSVWDHALKVTTNNYVAHNNLGNYLGAHGDMDAAVAHYREAVRINPGYAEAYNNLGMALAQRGELAEAVPCYVEAARLWPASATVRHNLGLALLRLGRPDEAGEHFAAAVRLRPGYARAHFGLGRALQQAGRTGEAVESFRRAVKLHPDMTVYQESLAAAVQAQRTADCSHPQ